MCTSYVCPRPIRPRQGPLKFGSTHLGRPRPAFNSVEPWTVGRPWTGTDGEPMSYRLYMIPALKDLSSIIRSLDIAIVYDSMYYTSRHFSPNEVKPLY